VLVSHCHYDHLDLRSLRALHDRHRPLIVTPLGNAAIMRRSRRPLHVVERDWGEAHALGEGVTAHLAPALHWSKRTPFDRNHALWAAFVVETPAGIVYFAGDTGYGTGAHFRAVRRRFGPPRLAILPIGAYEPRWFLRPQHMNPQEAVAAHLDLEAGASLAIHHGTLKLTNEAIDDPLSALDEALIRRGVRPERFRALACGESWSLDRLADEEAGVLEVAAE
jgi:L-ascorbate metabolism protein UlaG (beta-lactamase superfamily)